jgi:anti-sigma-K factor RskA
MEHREIQGLLYDFVAGTLPAHERDVVGAHCESCAECRAHVAAIGEMLEHLPAPCPQPSETRSEEFWTAFAQMIEERIRAETAEPPGVWRQMMGHIEQFLTEYWKPATAAAGVLAAALLAVILFGPSPTREIPTDVAAVGVSATPDSAAVQLAKYLRKSRTLLVGIQNMELSPGSIQSLAAERRVSRQLASESREMQGKSLDPQSEDLVRDLEKLFITLSAAEGETQQYQLDLLRAGVERENILFKIRMAETAYGSGPLVQTASAHRE